MDVINTNETEANANIEPASEAPDNEALDNESLDNEASEEAVSIQAVCLCGCGEQVSGKRRFLQGHDQRAYGRLNRLSNHNKDNQVARPNDGLVLAPGLIGYHQQDPSAKVVKSWKASGIIDLYHVLLEGLEDGETYFNPETLEIQSYPYECNHDWVHGDGFRECEACHATRYD